MLIAVHSYKEAMNKQNVLIDINVFKNGQIPDQKVETLVSRILENVLDAVLCIVLVFVLFSGNYLLT